ncbi:GTPase activating protein [Ascosphaera atra]|nr:GTPase activating protein [Ascosphaera atra]
MISAKDNIPGYIALIQRRNTRKPENTDPSTRSQSQSQAKDQSTYLLAWVPEASLGDARDTYVKVDMIDSESPPVQSYIVPPLPTSYSPSSSIGLYAFAIPLTDIFSLLVRPPSLGWWYGSLVINTRLGETFPALFFHDSECESTILQKKKRTRESFDPFSDDGTLFWGGDEVLRWLRRYANVQRSAVDSSVYLLNPTEEDLVAFCRRSSTGKLERGLRASEDNKTAKDAGMDPFTKLLKETRWKVLEQLSKITTFTRRTAHDLADNPSVPPQVRRLLKNPEIQTLQNEFDSARLYLARWAMGIAEQSERERNQRIWTAKDLLQREKSSVGDFEILDMESLTSQISRKPVTFKEWNSWFDTTGRLLITVNEVKERLFHGGLDPEDGVRKEAWLFLLGVFPWDSSRDERKVIDSSIRDEYVRLKGVWWERLAGETSTREEIEWFRDERHRIGKCACNKLSYRSSWLTSEQKRMFIARTVPFHCSLERTSLIQTLTRLSPIKAQTFIWSR